uniref:DDE Tnp4 domain-containing protein n=1 Tax=Trichogramma kaykai TaxID=54128 RepID=A0ABD2WZ61_9HYME
MKSRPQDILDDTRLFKNNYLKTRVTLDATELKLDTPSNPTLKQATFNIYKNSNTLKVMVGSSRGGLISYISEPYGGSTSDRQIIEHSDLRQKCESGDVILADKGIMVQDLFAPCNVTACTPTPMVSGNLSHNVIVKDKKLSKHRVHVERIIGLMKTYTILSKKLTRDLLPLSSEIIRVCIMLANFKDNIM